MSSPGSNVDGKVTAVVPIVPSQSLPSYDVFVDSKVLSTRPTKSTKWPYVVGYVLSN